MPHGGTVEVSNANAVRMYTEPSHHTSRRGLSPYNANHGAHHVKELSIMLAETLGLHLSGALRSGYKLYVNDIECTTNST